MQPSDAVDCGACGADLPRPQGSTQQESTELMGHFLPVNVSVWGVFAGYLGLFSILVIPAPFAILCSIMTLRDLKKNPRHYGMLRAVIGFIGGGIGLLLGGVILYSYLTGTP